MENIFTYVEFVNAQAAFHEKKAQEFQGSKRERLHKATGEQFRGLLSAIEELRNATILRQPAGSNPLALTQADVKDLPAELLQQLVNLPENDKLENDIVEIINAAGGTLLLDHLLIALFKRNQEIYQRNLMVSKLYRMNKKGLVFSTSKKGVYTTVRPKESDGKSLPLADDMTQAPDNADLL